MSVAGWQMYCTSLNIGSGKETRNSVDGKKALKNGNMFHARAFSADTSLSEWHYSSVELVDLQVVCLFEKMDPVQENSYLTGYYNENASVIQNPNEKNYD